jgi:hypothetical protein
MFIERAISKRFFLAPTCATSLFAGNIALRWSAGCGQSGSINIWLLWSQELLAASQLKDRNNAFAHINNSYFAHTNLTGRISNEK